MATSTILAMILGFVSLPCELLSLLAVSVQVFVIGLRPHHTSLFTSLENMKMYVKKQDKKEDKKNNLRLVGNEADEELLITLLLMCGEGCAYQV